MPSKREWVTKYRTPASGGNLEGLGSEFGAGTGESSNNLNNKKKRIEFPDSNPYRKGEKKEEKTKRGGAGMRREWKTMFSAM